MPKTRQNIKWIIPLAITLFVLGIGPCLLFMGDSFISGPGSADYCFPVIGALSLERSSGKRHVLGWISLSPRDLEQAMRDYERSGSSYVLVDADITALGWNDRIIVCYQADSPLAKERIVGWWVIDTYTHRRIGPLTKTEMQSTIEGLGCRDVRMQPPDMWRNSLLDFKNRPSQ